MNKYREEFAETHHYNINTIDNRPMEYAKSLEAKLSEAENIIKTYQTTIDTFIEDRDFFAKKLDIAEKEINILKRELNEN